MRCSVPTCNNPAWMTLSHSTDAKHSVCRACREEITAFYERAKASIENSSTLTGVKK